MRHGGICDHYLWVLCIWFCPSDRAGKARLREVQQLLQGHSARIAELGQTSLQLLPCDLCTAVTLPPLSGLRAGPRGQLESEGSVNMQSDHPAPQQLTSPSWLPAVSQRESRLAGETHLRDTRREENKLVLVLTLTTAIL